MTYAYAGQMKRRALVAAFVSLLGLTLTGCVPNAETVAIRTLDGEPGDYRGGIEDLLIEKYHAEWDNEGEILLVSAVFATTCVAVPTQIGSDTDQVIVIALEPHQAEFPCRDNLHAVTFEFHRPSNVESSKSAALEIDNVRVEIPPRS